MPRSMEDFVATRVAAGETDVRIAVPVFLPGYSAIGTVSTEDDQIATSLLATLYSIPNQLFRIVKRTIDKSRKPNQSVHEAAKHRNFEVVFTGTEVHYCPASPLLANARPPTATRSLAEVSVVFETVANAMSHLTIDTDVWHVHPEYAGDVRWELRRIAEQGPAYDISFES